jgi:hypothetical protein
MRSGRSCFCSSIGPKDFEERSNRVAHVPVPQGRRIKNRTKTSPRGRDIALAMSPPAFSGRNESWGPANNPVIAARTAQRAVPTF